MHLSLFDIIASAIFLGSSILGIYRGFTISLLGILTFILTIVLTFILFPFSKDILKEHISNNLAINICSIIISYLVSKLSCSWTFRLLKEALEKYSGGIIDRSLGLWIGSLRGFALSLSAFIALGVITSGSYVGAKNYWQIFSNINETEYPKWLQKSYSYFIMQNSYSTSKNWLEKGIISNYLESIKINSNNNIIQDNQNGIKPENKEIEEKITKKIEDQVINKLQDELIHKNTSNSSNQEEGTNKEDFLNLLNMQSSNKNIESNLD